jgi:hypothetical protein
LERHGFSRAVSFANDAGFGPRGLCKARSRGIIRPCRFANPSSRRSNKRCSKQSVERIQRIELHLRPNCRRQPSAAGRTQDDVGFFTRFAVDRSSSAPIGGERLRNGPTAKVDGLKCGMGFILWLEAGYANCLEGYAYGDDSTTALMFDAVRFEIAKQPDAGPIGLRSIAAIGARVRNSLC